MPLRSARILDALDRWACRLRLLPSADWASVKSGKVTKLYAGRLYRGTVQYHGYLGITPFEPSTRNIPHDIRDPLPVPDGTIEIFQAEDVFEHIPYEGLANIIDEIYRVLKPGGVFRLSVPDYRCDVYLTRVMRNDHGDIVFDPGGGGQFETGRVVGGGHLWFPVYESVKSLFDRTSFARNGEVRYLHYTDSSGAFVLRPIDHSLGPVRRTPDHDVRARDPRRPLSIVVDAIKNG